MLNRCLPLLLINLALLSNASAQAPGVPIVEQSDKELNREDENLHRQIKLLATSKEILTQEKIETQLKTPTGRKFELLSPSKKKLEPSKVAQHARASSYRVGIAYICNRCDTWHTNLAGGYAVSHDGILATCAHVLELGKDFKTQTIIAVDMKGKVYPVKEIVANHKEMDTALLRIDAKTTPLALNEIVQPGDAAYCLSRPLEQRQYFSAGIVNRFYWKSPRRGKNDLTLQALSHLRLNVSTPWAPGSSGAPILDTYANVIGHVSEIAPLGESEPDDTKQFIPFMTLHLAIPARTIRALASAPQEKSSTTAK